MIKKEKTSLDETFEKCSISFKFKEGENIALTVAPYGLKKYTSCNHRNTLSISRIALKLDFVQNLSLTKKLGERGRFAKVYRYVTFLWDVANCSHAWIQMFFNGKHIELYKFQAEL